MRERLASALLIALILPPEGDGSRVIRPVVAFAPMIPRGCQAATRTLRVPLHRLLSGLHHDPVDDDDVSQHEFMANGGQNETSVAFGEVGDDGSDGCRRNVDDRNENTNTKRKGYRPIEDWHDEYKNQNADEFKAITHLRRERARWGKRLNLWVVMVFNVLLLILLMQKKISVCVVPYYHHSGALSCKAFRRRLVACFALLSKTSPTTLPKPALTMSGRITS